MKLTDLERATIRGIIDSDYRDGYAPVGHWVWSWSANPFGKDKRRFSGTVSSLIKKGAIKSTDTGTDDACLAITAEGYEAFKVTETPLRWSNGKLIPLEGEESRKGGST